MSEIKISELPEIFTIPTTALAAVVTGGTTYKIQKANMGFARLYVSSTTPTGTRTSGDIWVDTSGTDPVFKTWDGVQWVAQTFSTTPGAGTVPIASLEDIASQRIIGRISASTGAVEILTPAQARSVLELVAVATSGSATDLTTGTLPDARLSGAVAASLLLADSAVQPGDLATVATTGDYDDLTNKPDLSHNRFVRVKSLSDFPAPSGGLITLAAGTTYVIDGPIDIGVNELVAASGTKLLGKYAANDQIIHTSAGACIKGEDVTFSCESVGFVNASGTGIIFTEDADPDIFLNVLNCGFFGCNEGVQVNGGNTSVIFNTLFSNCTTGITCTDFNKVLIAQNAFLGNSAGNRINFTSGSYVDADITQNKFQGDSGTMINVADATDLTGQGTIINNRFRGTATPISGVSATTTLWSLSLNDGIPNTRITGYMRFTGNSTETTINTINVWEKIDIATTANSLAGFSHTSPNRLTYTRGLTRQININASIDAEVGTVNQLVEVAIFKNGTIVADTAREIELNTSGVSKSITILSFVELAQNDFIELYIRNRSGTANITVKSMAVTALGVSL